MARPGIEKELKTLLFVICPSHTVALELRMESYREADLCRSEPRIRAM